MYAKYSGWLKRQRTRPRVNRVYIVPGHTYETWKINTDYRPHLCTRQYNVMIKLSDPIIEECIQTTIMS